MYTITYFSNTEYQRIPLFNDRDVGSILAWETRKEAQKQLDLYQGSLYKAEIVDTATLPFQVFNMSDHMRREAHAATTALDYHLAMGGSEPD